MLAVRLKGKVTRERKLQITLPKEVAPGEVEVILLHDAPSKPKRVRKTRGKTAHPAFGLWANRTDSHDSAEFARQLRQKIQTRGA